MQEEPVRWLQLTYRVPSEPSQKRVWVWRKLQNCGAYALQNSVYLLPSSEEVEKQFRQLAHDIHEMGGEACVFAVVALDVHDEERILHALLEARKKEYYKVCLVCSRFLVKTATLIETQIWNDQVHAEFAEVMEKVHVLFRTAKRHDMLGNKTATSRAEAAEAIAVCEQMFRILLDTEFGKARRLLEMHQELLLPATNADVLSKELPQASPDKEAAPSFSNSQQCTPESSKEGVVEPPI
jgi:CRISPR/Cas system-associated endoribonuclease Cas2